LLFGLTLVGCQSDSGRSHGDNEPDAGTRVDASSGADSGREAVAEGGPPATDGPGVDRAPDSSVGDAPGDRLDAGDPPDAGDRFDAGDTFDAGDVEEPGDAATAITPTPTRTDAGMANDAGAEAATNDADGGHPLLVSGPELESFNRAPLARELRLTTSEPTTVEVVVERDDRIEWRRHFDDLATGHALPLLGFVPDETYSVRVTLYTAEGDSIPISDPLTIETDPLPDDWPPMQVLTSNPAQMEPGYTLLSVLSRSGATSYTMVLDNAGQPVWFTDRGTNELRQLPDGTILFIGSIDLRLMNMYGQVTQRWHGTQESNPAQGSIPVDVPVFHHEVFPMQNGNFLSLSRRITDVAQYPTSYTDLSSTAPASVVEELVVELVPETGEVAQLYSLHDILDPTRIGYDSLSNRYGGLDWGHANAVIHVPEDDTYIVSLRHQDAVVKIARSTGELIWILGAHENWSAKFQPYLLTPTGARFEWPYHSHSPQVTSSGTLMLFDNGNGRAIPPDGRMPGVDRYSRAVEYEIDARAMTISQVWAYGDETEERLYSSIVSDANAMPLTGNALITFGALVYIDGEPLDTDPDHNYGARIIEVTRDAAQTKLFDVFIDDGVNGRGGWTVARATRFSSLYGD
jgi:arylsulfate sulfotransferase